MKVKCNQKLIKLKSTSANLIENKNSKQLRLKTGIALKNNKDILKVNKEKNTPKRTTTPKKLNSDGDNELLKHKKELEKLKDIDPEFYNFLKQNDKKLLEFNFDDSDGDSIIEDDKEETTKTEQDEDNVFHKPSEELEIASDESEFEEIDNEKESECDVEDGTKTKIITLKLLKTWQMKLQEKRPSVEIIRKVIQAFSSALCSLSGEERKLATYKVEGSAIFNGIVQLCVLHLQPAIMKFLGIALKSKQPLHKCKKWKKIRSSLRSYFIVLVDLLEHVSSTNILTVLLKHLHQMANMILSFSTISKTILKRLIVLWSTSSDETVRVLSFLCILKITCSERVKLLNHVLKAMYLSYVRNSKFVSPNTLANINFMRKSLVEMFALDLNVSYQHVFLYIRQLAIHLRNAIILKKKDSFQAVYNWQFINSIRLWSELMGSTTEKPQLQPLIYPLISIVIGVIKLIPTAQYFPLRFHCIQALITLQRKTNRFISVLPFILEVLNSNTFNKKHTIVSMKPMQFTFILRLNKAQMAENGFRDEVIENVYGLILEYLEHESASLAYPDLIVPVVYFLKKYLKGCKNSNYVRKLKQLLDKIIENSKFIEEERVKITFSFKDLKDIKAWEAQLRSTGTPLNIYYSNWIKTLETKKKRQAANTDGINDDYDIPSLKRKKNDSSSNDKRTNNVHNHDEFELFPSEDDEDENIQQLNKKNNDKSPVKKDENKKKTKQKKQRKESEFEITQEEDEEEYNIVDIVRDLDVDDW